MVTIDCDNGNLVEDISSLEGRKPRNKQCRYKEEGNERGESCRKKETNAECLACRLMLVLLQELS